MIMTASSLLMDKQACFLLKTNFAPCTILQLTRYDLTQLESQLHATIQRTPHFFMGSPVIIDLEKVRQLGPLNFTKMKDILLANQLVPIGVRNGSEEQQCDAATYGLPTLTIGRLSHGETGSHSSQKKETHPRTHQTKLVSTPIRSGMQVYAKDGDLVVTAPVSVGAELLADGHIHVYGPLRGRAIAGVQGNTDARIFCSLLEAELVSIAGYYLTKEEMPLLDKTQSVIQIFLEKEKIKIEPIL